MKNQEMIETTYDVLNEAPALRKRLEEKLAEFGLSIIESQRQARRCKMSGYINSKGKRRFFDGRIYQGLAFEGIGRVCIGGNSFPKLLEFLDG